MKILKVSTFAAVVTATILFSFQSAKAHVLTADENNAYLVANSPRLQVLLDNYAPGFQMKVAESNPTILGAPTYGFQVSNANGVCIKTESIELSWTRIHLECVNRRGDRKVEITGRLNTIGDGFQVNSERVQSLSLVNGVWIKAPNLVSELKVFNPVTDSQGHIQNFVIQTHVDRTVTTSVAQALQVRSGSSSH